MLRIALTALIVLNASLTQAKSSDKVVVIGEKLVEHNPWRDSLIKRQYAVAKAEAFREHRLKFPNSTVSIVESFGDPLDAFALAEKENALAVAGFLYSPDAVEAAQVAKARKMPYLSPVSPLDSVTTDYSYSLGVPHSSLKESFAKARSLFDNPSLVVVNDTHLTNLEYARIYQEAFNVVKVYRGSSAQVWQTLSKELSTYTEKGDINVLFAGLAFEQMDLVRLIGASNVAHRTKLIAHSQWNYCPQILSASLPQPIKNLYIVSDYFDPEALRAKGFHVPATSIESYMRLKAVVFDEPKVHGQSIHEPIVYVLRDMIAMALEVAERSSTREEFNRNYSALTYLGAAGEYRVATKGSKRKVYLGTWEGTGTLPQTIL